MGRRNRRNNGGILSGIAGGIENDLGLGGSSGGGGRRNRGGGNHATAGDIVHDGMKYAAIFGVAQQGLKAYSQRNGNGNGNGNNIDNNPRDMGNGPGGWMSAPPSMQQQQFQQPPYQQPQRYIQYADPNQSQYPRQIQYGGENQNYYQQQQRGHDQPQDRGLQRDDEDEDDAPPAYVEESKPMKGHQSWCNGSCAGVCMQR